MNPSDIKKFIAGFLILAVVASTSALLFANYGSQPATGKTSPQQTARANPYSKNAFVEGVPSSQQPQTTAGSFDGLPQPTSKNLTDNLSWALANQILVENPNGPSATNGTLEITAPDLDKIINQFADNSNLAKSVQLSPITIHNPKELKDYTSQDVVSYLTSLNSIVQKGISSQEVDSILSNDPSTEALNALRLRLSETSVRLQNLTVPTPLMSLHVAVAKPLVALTDAVNELSTQGASDDPVKSLVLFGSRMNQVQEAAGNINAEIQKIKQGVVSLQKNPSIHGVLSLAMVPTVHAYAGWPVMDSQLGLLIAPILTSIAGTTGTTAGTTGALTFWEKVVKYLKTIALQFAKNSLVHNIIAQTVNFIKGGGKPQFVTDWNGFLAGAANTAAGLAISTIAPGLCKSFGPLVRLQLESTYLASPQVTCTLDQVVANVENFYNDFSQGGWIGFGQLALPSGNYFGQLFEGSQIVELRQLAAKDAAAREAQAASGYLPTGKCISSHITNAYKKCLADAAATGASAASQGAMCFYLSEHDADVSTCDKYETTTPGAALSASVNDAIGITGHRIVNAEDVTALITALADALMSRIVAFGADRFNSPGLTGIQIATTTVSTDPNKSPCFGMTGDALTECIAGLSGICSGLTGTDLTQCIGIACGGLTGDALSKCTASVTATSCNTAPSAFGSARCPGQCQSSPGTTAYELRVGHTDLDVRSWKLFNVGTGDPLDYKTWEWSVAPPASDTAAWCNPNPPDLGRTSPPDQPPQLPSMVRCIDGSSGGFVPACTPPPVGGGGGGDCGKGCACKPEVSQGQFCFLGYVLEAQGALQAAYNAGDTTTGLGGTNIVSDRTRYPVAVAEKITAAHPELEVLAPPDPAGESQEIGIRGRCDLAFTGSVIVPAGLRREQTRVMDSSNNVSHSVPNAICLYDVPN